MDEQETNKPSNPAVKPVVQLWYPNPATIEQQQVIDDVYYKLSTEFDVVEKNEIGSPRPKPRP